jgi:catechol 2,3-dioxygenase-like lactoylglutathione lyase family enzyme
MQQRLSFVTLGVANLAASRLFYEHLGWKAAKSSNEHVAFFQLNGLALGLFGRQALAADAGVKNDRTGFDGVALAYNVRQKSQVAKQLAQAAAAGAKITQPAHDVFWGGHSGYFADPDGHLWEICWNPFFDLDRKGNLFLGKKKKSKHRK